MMQQEAKWPSETSSIGGGVDLHKSSANGHLGWNLQPSNGVRIRHLAWMIGRSVLASPSSFDSRNTVKKSNRVRYSRSS